MPEPSASNEPFELSAEETQVMLGRYAGASVPELSRSTGMPVEAVEGIVSRLTALGLLGDEPAEREPEPEHQHADDDLVALLEAATLDLLPGGAPRPPALPPHVEPAPRPSRMTPASRRRIEEALPDGPLIAPEIPLAEAPSEEADDADAGGDDGAPEPAEETREYRKLFETELRPLPLDERVAMAGTVSGARLLALCFDPSARVILALFDNAGLGLDHARLIAFHHRDSRGLEALVQRPAITSDPQVHRRLLRNPGLTEPMQKRLMASKRLHDVYRLSHDRDLPDKNRAAARSLFRTRYTSAPSEERAELVVSTEGRVLVGLVGLTFDSRMTSILCSKTYASIMLVQNLARFPATPPALLAHLLRQPLVKRQPHLKNLLLQHPNTPSEAKRRV